MTDNITDEAAAKASYIVMDSIVAILSGHPDTLSCLPVRAVLIYEFMREDGSIGMQIFGANDIWNTDALGMIELAKHMMLVDYLSDDDDDDSGSNEDNDDDHNHPSQL